MEEVKGYIDHIVYRKDETGYTVISMISEGKEVICVGKLPALNQGENIKVWGEVEENPSYGPQIRIARFELLPPEDSLGVERYLGSGAIKGIGPALAKKIVDRFGEDSFRIIEEEPERLTEIKGISERIARDICGQMEEKKELRQAMLFLQQYGISNTVAVKIYDRYGTTMYPILRENPYRLAEDISGIGFKMADEIAAKMGVKTDSDYRVKSGILYTLLLAGGEGHVYLPEDILLRNAVSLLQVSLEQVELQLKNLSMEKKVVLKEEQDTTLVYSAKMYWAQLQCARLLLDRFSTMEENQFDSEKDKFHYEAQMNRIQKKIEQLARINKMELDEYQTKAVKMAVTNSILLLTGGPGTGKTTTINTMIQYFEQEGLDLVLAAPTGRAAKRMTEATGFEASTIHRLLELNGKVEEESGGGARFERNEENPLEVDVVIIDEMSMVDMFLFQALLKAISPGTRLILVGDVNQLPSVGPGRVLQDVMESGVFPVVELHTIHRQSEGSDIVVNAHKIQQGMDISLENKSKDFFFLERGNPQVIYKHILELILEKLPPYLKVDPMEIQVLTPMKKGPLGVASLNPILQQYCNPQSPEKPQIERGEVIFRQGDKVMQTRNNYQMEWEIVSSYGIPVDKGVGVFNGDIGVIKEIQPANHLLIVEFDDARLVQYPFALLEELELAYALTIHKSQGSEYPAVILPLLGGPKQLFNRNLFYTGVTRAKQCVTILGSSQTVKEMIANVEENKRYSGLSRTIREMRGEVKGAI